MKKTVILKVIWTTTFLFFYFRKRPRWRWVAFIATSKLKNVYTAKKLSCLKLIRLRKNIIRQARQNGQKALDEHAAKELLSCYGAPVTKEVLAMTVEEALAVAEKIGYPVALKACSWKIMHKSGKGLIALNVENANN